MRAEDKNKDLTSNDGNTLLVAGTNDGLSVGFTCKICEETQTLEVSYYRANEVFPICNQCLKDLKEFVLSKRQGAYY